MRGSIRIDVERLKKLGDDVRPALGLLALTLRDLAESDISFGWGSSKGYGWATADTGGLSPTKWVEALLKGLSEGDVKSWIIDWEREAMLNA